MSYFLSNKNLKDGENCEITGPEAAHILLARRVKIGEKIKLQGPDQKRFLAEVVSFSKKSLFVKVLEELALPKEPVLHITLFQALIAENALDNILQKSTELGVAKVVLFNAKNTPAHLSDKVEKKLERWQKIALEAAKQSDRAKPAGIVFTSKLNEELKQLDKVFLLEKNSEKAFRNYSKEKFENLGLLVGPEGGFTDEEVKNFEGLKNVLSVKLGPRILRADTAATTAVSIVQSMYGDI